MPYKDRETYLRKQREFYLRRKAKRLSNVGVNASRVRVSPSTPQVRSFGQVSAKPSTTRGRPSSTPELRHISSQPQHDKNAMFRALRDAANMLANTSSAPTVLHGRYKKMMDIPSEVLAKYGITRNGNVLSAGPGVDIQAVLRRLM